MAAVQATIPFKFRKKTYARAAQRKIYVENLDILTTGELKKTKKFKRHNEDHDCNFESDLLNGKYVYMTIKIPTVLFNYWVSFHYQTETDLLKKYIFCICQIHVLRQK